jgi:mono/diheme cytochrome c family protein
MVTGVFTKHATTRPRLIRYAAIWAFVGTVLAIPALYWYHGLLPAGAAEMLAGSMPKAALAAKILFWGGLALAVTLLIPIIYPKHVLHGSVFSFAIAALALFGASEWIRESVRKPYIIYDYMYGTGLTVSETEAIRDGDGLIANALWVENRPAAPTQAVGKDVFRVACRSCHTLDGYRGLKSRLQGLDEEFVYELFGRLEHLRGAMPPFAGNEIEQRALAMYLSNEAGTQWAMIDGEEVFDKRCGFCHSRDSYLPLQESLEGLTPEELIEMWPELGDMADEMAPWSGTDEDARLLADFIHSWYETEDAPDEEEN